MSGVSVCLEWAVGSAAHPREVTPHHGPPWGEPNASVSRRRHGKPALSEVRTTLIQRRRGGHILSARTPCVEILN